MNASCRLQRMRLVRRGGGGVEGVNSGTHQCPLCSVKPHDCLDKAIDHLLILPR